MSIMQAVTGKQFDASGVRLDVLWRFDEREVGIRNCGTPTGTQQGVVVFDERDFRDFIEAVLPRSGAPDDAQIGQALYFLYEHASRLGAKQTMLLPDEPHPPS